MGNKSGRRSFIKHLGMSGVGTVILPATTLLANESTNKQSDFREDEIPGQRVFNGSYTGAYLNRVAFPIGGLGAGMFCMEGTGAISHMSVRNRPEVFHEPSVFAAISIKGLRDGAKVLEGPVPDWKKFGRKDAGNGATGATTGLPRFHGASFQARFPFGQLDLQDKDLSLKVKVIGWSPFIPGDEDNSSLPVGAMEYHFINSGTSTLEAVFSFNAKNFLAVENGQNAVRSIQNGFVLSEKGIKEKPLRSDFAIYTDDNNTVVDHCWFRGGWWDPLTMAWNAVKNADLISNTPVEKDAPGASLYVPFSLLPGGKKVVRVMFAWYTPESDLAIGDMGTRKENCNPDSGCCNSPADIGLDKYDKDFNAPFYKPWYSSRFINVEEVADFWSRQYDTLYRKSTLFKDAFYSSSLPPVVMEAIAANLTILKSPTVLRQFDGRLWSFEGCSDDNGCCHGSCTHVWNYAQAIPHLFPALERSLRSTEFCESQDEKGHQNFRSALPIKPATHEFHAAADGQLGGIMKVYREWRISGDSLWMKKIYPMVQKSMDYCISTWDPHRKGIIEEPHHNTYDIEFWGPDGMHCSFYIGALDALIAMGAYLGKDMTTYKALAEKGRTFLEKDLYDGEYFIQKIQFTGLNAPSPAVAQSFGGEYSKEARILLEKEGPKYQYGKGCLSDGVLGAWIARMCGLNDPVDAVKVRSHLKAVHKYNLRKNLSEHANPQRPSFALGEEGGLLLCTWPKGGKLSLPFVYSDEVWTGIEHQVAAHLMLLGQVKEGIDILNASRNRYDGRIRNPFNEYECGHWYARALSSYGYFQALTGVRYDAVDKTLFIDSKIGDFTSFLSAEQGFGTVTVRQGKVSVKVAHGKIDINTIDLSGNKKTFKQV
ncbi:GH116 family glycosyl hydrolase [Flavihumibacter fluvii]|uniref:GH116 family glycosyl hydrolase n=1 Tax=Flavihumibacter fluvii TaxID=2838157 RepID=UPI001BDF1831|nr:GH116 family glycosyl hydrolase [Flavihumibacter fluvii]ULQ50849.1 non-lysosomal glucosylceramidase [Flavihumibacter fluvii]